MTILEIIDKKKNNEVLTKEEIEFFVNEYTKENSSIQDYQMSSLLMAIYLNGLTKDETYYLTNAMQKSGKQVILSSDNKIMVDKHSSGGIGDKVTLILTPILSCLGFNVAKMSGRGLSYTGGTIDKLESINVETEYSIDEAQKLMNEFGMFVMSQTKDIVPADKKLYALRDVSGTVESLPLIVSSIMSKKICINSDYIFLDIKVGDGAFFKNIKQAEKFSEYALYVSEKSNRKTTIHLTNMNVPLGYNVGNKLEVIEAVQYLNSEKVNPFLDELIVHMAADILVDTKTINNQNEAIRKVKDLIASKKPLYLLLDYFKKLGSNLDFLNIQSWFNPRYSHKIYADKTGYLNIKKCKEIGLTSLYLGAGRKTKTDILDFDAGIEFNKEYNAKVESGELIATLYSNKEISNDTITLFTNNLEIVKKPEKNTKIIYKKISSK